MKKIMVTGCAGFIGAALTRKLVLEGNEVIGIDNINDYYDISLKKSRLKNITSNRNKNNSPKNFNFFQCDISNLDQLNNIFLVEKPDIVVNLAAQAGVRFSLEKPQEYLKSNLVGFHNILFLCKKFRIENLIYASSSSVYGGNENRPFCEDQSVDHPVSFYAATKKCNEIMAHSYSHLYELPCTGLRFFTVYGPWGRPDMAPMIFTKAIINGEQIKIFNNGEMYRDFTYIDDVVEGIYKCCRKPAEEDMHFDKKNPNPSTSFAKHRILNIGNSKPIKLTRFIEILERELGKKAKKIYLPMQLGDVKSTSASIEKLDQWIGFKPFISIEEGISRFVEWYRSYY